ncbi:type III-A CRISPR-associated RAMP protein Csm4 [Calothrix sp. HK-06]|nr:type III-A CRISPR-associated RAMP protein Csm4 [Calothrix sp. HK-06]
MSNWKLIKLDFERSPAHFGELGIGMEETSERVYSDTLFSALMTTWAKMYGKDSIEMLLRRFLDKSPPARISSTFIYQQHPEGTTYYLPRPLGFPINYPVGDDLEFFKTYKKLSFLPLKVWQRWYQQSGFSGADAQELIERTETKDSKGNLALAKTFDYKKTHYIERHPKIAVDRVTQATNFYHTGYVQFESETNRSGLYFLLNLTSEDKRLENELHACLHLLGEEGLGGERSSGVGRFKVDWQPLPSEWKPVVNYTSSKHHCLMSLFWDDDKSKLAELIAEDSAYQIRERGGWISSFSGEQLRRQFIRMFVEGSVLSAEPQGKLADVTPSLFKKHRIYRSGIGLSIPIKVGG